MPATAASGEPPLCPPPPAMQHRLSGGMMPPGAVDAHARVIGWPPRHPWMRDCASRPPPVSASDYLKRLDDVGTQYGALVQASGHGQHTPLMLDTLAPWGPAPAVRDAILTTHAQRLYGFR